ncbi:MAG TPA: transposase [Mycobacterium sp.]
MISDELWSVIEPVLPSGRRRGRPWNDHRLALEGIIWRFRTGGPARMQLAGGVVAEFGAACAGCPLAAQCTAAPAGRAQ